MSDKLFKSIGNELEDIWKRIDLVCPECSTMWDIQGGPEWLGNEAPRIYIMTNIDGTIYSDDVIRVFKGPINALDVSWVFYNCKSKSWNFP
jgi:hypothetical protein